MKFIISLFTCLLAICTQAQTLHELIPNSSSTITYLNLNNLNTKSGGEPWHQLLEPFLKTSSSYYYYNSYKPILDINNLILKVTESGIDMNSPVYIYKTKVKQLTGQVILFKLKNKEQFVSYIGKEEIKVEIDGTDGSEDATETTETVYFDDYYDNDYSVQNEIAYFEKKAIGNGELYISEKQVIGIYGDVAYIFNIDNGSSYVLEKDLIEQEQNKDKYDSDYAYAYDSYSSYDNGYKDSIYFAEINDFRRKTDSMMYLNLNTLKDINYQTEADKFTSIEPSIISRAKQRKKDREAEVLKVKFSEWAILLGNMGTTKADNIGLDRNFTATLKGNHDIFSYTKFNEEMLNILSSSAGFGYYGRHSKREDKPFPKILEGISSIYTIDLNNGQAILNALSNLNDQLSKPMAKAYSLKQNKNLLKYIDGSNLQGYFSYSVNSMELSKPYEAIYFEILDNLSRSSDISAGVEMFWAFIDKDMLFNTTGNQTILAVTGYSDMKVEYISYDYDENFGRVETKEERLVKQPKVVLVSAINNKANAEKLFNIFSKFSFVEKVNDNLLKINSNREFKTNTYILMTSDAFVVTNDPVLALKNPNGYPSKQQISSDDQKFILSHNFVAKTYTDNILNGIRNNYFTNGGYENWYTPLYNGLGNLEMYDSPIKNNQYSFRAVVNFKDVSSNSFNVMIKMMNALKDVH